MVTRRNKRVNHLKSIKNWMYKTSNTLVTCSHKNRTNSHLLTLKLNKLNLKSLLYEVKWIPWALNLSSNFNRWSLVMVLVLVSLNSHSFRMSCTFVFISNPCSTIVSFRLHQIWWFLARISSAALDLKRAERVLFLRVKTMRVRPSHSMKLMLGIGFMGSSRTTLESTWWRNQINTSGIIYIA